MAPTQLGGGGNYGGTVPMPTVASESGNTFHLTKAPTLWALGFLVIGVLMLMYIHYK
jgi:hypothetical protein